MNTLKGDTILLRALEPSDLDFLYQLENRESLWEVSSTITPYSRYILQEYINNSYRDIFDVKQLRLVICTVESTRPIGLIDLFDFDPKNRRVGVGIVVFVEKEKRKGAAFEALQLICEYAFRHLNVHQVFAGVGDNNTASIRLFEKAGFIKTGTKEDWNFWDGKFRDEFFYQLIR